MNRSITSVVIAAAVLVVLAGAATPANAAPGKTLDNLQAAFNGESNAHARYLAFAEKAQQEGYGSVASLFRAAARAEQVHANNHATVIRKLRAEPKSVIETPVVASTLENLKAAIKGESYERDTMYPDFIRIARAEGNHDALRTFNLAKTAEAGHADLYGASVKNFASLKGATRTYYVCEVCGLTTTSLDFAKCMSCFSPKDRYVAVS